MPEAATVKVADEPWQTVCGCGCVVMAGGVLTVTVATEELAEEQTPLVTTAR